jgi:hypothetical protein
MTHFLEWVTGSPKKMIGNRPYSAFFTIIDREELKVPFITNTYNFS